MEEMMINDANRQIEDWDLFFEFAMADAQMDPNDKKSSVLAMEVDLVTATDPIFENGQTIV